MTTQIVVMRHAEKPDDPMDPDLTPAGQQRAVSLARFIPGRFGTPDFIFAASISKNSARPYETVKPLSKMTGIPIDATYADQDYGALAQALRSEQLYQGKLIVVCWHHGNIPNLLHAFRAQEGQYPDPWGRDVFNLILLTKWDDNSPAMVTEVTEPF